jgi:dTDP-glucose 4,6-dehydratase
MRILVTGGAGFIGFNFVRELLAGDPSVELVVLDKLTYAGNARSIAELAHHGARFRFVKGCITDRALLRRLYGDFMPQAIVHFAAETHVDRSIDAPAEFIHTNVVGTFALLEELRHHLAAHPGSARFLHVSTDEVFGALGDDGQFSETSPYAPRSPYSASKAAGDHLVQAYFHTYGLPVITTNCSNNYGPYQYPEKLIPLTIANALAEKPLPVYGAGANVRDWLHVSDHCSALRAVMERGRVGETYLIGGRNEQKNLDVVHMICDLADEIRPRTGGGSHRELVSFVKDRLGHDFRYAIDPSKIERELGWRAEHSFADGLRATIAWYIERRDWTDAIHRGEHHA